MTKIPGYFAPVQRYTQDVKIKEAFMRTVNIRLTDTSVAFTNGKIAGRVGEHNATELAIVLPDSMITGIDYHTITFETGGGAITSAIITDDDTQSVYRSDSTIYCPLWQELTVSSGLSFTVEAYAIVDDEPVLITKSPLVSGLSFDLAVGEGEVADTAGHSIASSVRKLEEKAHSHSNKALLDSYSLEEHSHDNKTLLDSYTLEEHSHENKELLDTYSQTEQALSNAVSKAHSHDNLDALNEIIQAHDGAKADKVESPASDALAGLDSSGNLTDSGYTPDSFMHKLTLQGNGGFYESTAFDSVTQPGIYAVEYTDSQSNLTKYYTAEIRSSEGETVQYVGNTETLRRRSRTDGAWSNWRLSKFVRQFSANIPIEGHVPIYAAPLQDCNDAIIDSGRSIFDMVTREQGKDLSTNDFTDSLKMKLDSAEMCAQENRIESIKMNSSPLAVQSKAVDIPVHFITADTLADLPAGLPRGAAAYVRNDGNQLTFGQYQSLVCADDISLLQLPLSDAPTLSSVPSAQVDGTEDHIRYEVFRDDSGTPVAKVVIQSGGTLYACMNRAFTYMGTAYTKGWYCAQDGVDVAMVSPPVISDFSVVSIIYGDDEYTAVDTLPGGAESGIAYLSCIVNTDENLMKQGGRYISDGSSWALQDDKRKIHQYAGIFRPGCRYSYATGEDLAIVLPSAEDTDGSEDSTVLLYLNCTAETDVSFPASTLFYSGTIPSVIVGSNLIIMDYNAAAGTWCVGVLNAEVAS